MSFNNNKGENDFPYEIKVVEGEVREQFIKDFHGQPSGFVEIGPEKWILPEKFKHCANEIYNFEARPDDVWICTYPRSGTTWTQEMVWLICNDLNYDKAKKTTLNDRFPFFEFHLYLHDELKAKFLKENEDEQWKMDFIEKISVPGYKFFPEMTQQRFMKTHLPFKILPPSIMKNQAKVIYVARHPKDVVVSYYHLNKLYRTQGFVNDFDTFFEYFIKDALHWSPYFKHIKDGWEHRHEENVLFLFYEELTADLASSLKKLSEFLGKPLKDEDLPQLIDHLNIKNFKENTAVNGKDLIDVKVLSSDAQGFVRTGSTVKNTELTPEMAARIEVWVEENLKDTDFRFHC